MTTRHPVRFSVATIADLKELVADVRPEDALETVMAGMPDVAAATVESAMNSAACFSARCGDDLLCLFGVLPPVDGEAVVWEIGTSRLRKNAKAFLKASAYGMGLLMSMFPQADRFVNYIPSDWNGYVAWAKRYLGAEFDERDVLRGGHAFRRFVVRAKKGA